MTKILFDPGHGCEDYGATYQDLLEKGVVWRIGEHLMDVFPYASRTRKLLENPSHSRRAENVTSYTKAIVSLHCDSRPSGRVSGAYIFCRPGNSGDQFLASDIQNNLSALVRTSIFTHSQDWKRVKHVMDHYPASVPMVLIEYGDIKRDYARFKSDNYLKRLALSTAVGLLSFMEGEE